MKHLTPYNPPNNTMVKDYSLPNYSEPLKPKIGDYIIANEEELGDNDATTFVNSHIAKILKILKSNTYWGDEYVVKFENVPEEIDIKYNINNDGKTENYIHGLRKIYHREIVDWSNNKEDLEIKLKAKKYNL